MRALKEIISAGAHPVRPPLTQSGCFLHGCAELNSFVVGREKLVLSSSLLRHLDRNAINNCKIIPRPGKTYRTMDEEIRRGKINIANFKVIAFLLGTNDIDGAVYCKYGIVGYNLVLSLCLMYSVQPFFQYISVPEFPSCLLISSNWSKFFAFNIFCGDYLQSSLHLMLQIWWKPLLWKMCQ